MSGAVTAQAGKVDLTRDLIYAAGANPRLVTPPYPYQARVLAEVLAGLAGRGYHGLFLDMGTGKTLLTLYAYEQLLAAGLADHAVVVAPKALLTTWLDEAAKHTSPPRPFVVWGRGGAKKLEAALLAFASVPGQVFLVNVEAFQVRNARLAQFLESLLKTRRVLAVVDESSKIKSPQAARTKTLLKLAEAARYRLALTGTEVTNSPLDLYTQLKFLARDFWQGLPNFFAFRYRYAVLDTEYGPGGRSFQVVVGYQRQDELKRRVDAVSSRIKKEDVLDLPPKRYQDVWLEMPAALRKVYEELKAELAAEYEGKELTVANAAVLFGRARQLVGGYFPGPNGTPGRVIDANLKADYLADELEDTDEKVLVWACYREEVRLLTRRLPRAVALSGEQAPAERDAAVAAFRDPAGPRVLVANPAVAAYGLNLQHCRLVYWYSNPVSPEQRWQGEDRCHRIGQTGSVLYKDLLYRDSVDERVKALLAGKTEGRNFFRAGMTAKQFIEEVF